MSGPTPALAPDRPGPSPAAPSLARRRFQPVIVVSLALLIVVLGGFVTAATLGGRAASRVDVAGLVRVRPAGGWELASRGTLHGTWETAGGTVGDVRFARLTGGSANLDVSVVPGFEGTPQDLARWYASEILGRQLSQLTISDARATDAVSTDGVAIRFAYLGMNDTAIEGYVSVVVSARGTGVIFDAWAAQGSLAPSLDAVVEMMTGAQVA